MWLPAGGRSLWPLLRPGDSLKVQRVAPSDVRQGDVAVVVVPSGLLIAHVVVSTNPFCTASLAGVMDAPALEVLGRVVAYRRDQRIRNWPSMHRVWLRWVPGGWRRARRALRFFKKKQ